MESNGIQCNNMQNHTKKRKLYVKTDYDQEPKIILDPLPFYPPEKIMKTYIATEDEIVEHLYDGMLSDYQQWNPQKLKYESSIIPTNLIFQNQKRINKTLEDLLWGDMFDYLLFSKDHKIICIVKIWGICMVCIFLSYNQEPKKYSYHISHLRKLLEMLGRDDLIDTVMPSI